MGAQPAGQQSKEWTSLTEEHPGEDESLSDHRLNAALAVLLLLLFNYTATMSQDVQIIESERGFGQKVDETKTFDTKEEAKQFCREYNRKWNPPGPTPDWYMYARLKGRRGPGMLR